MSKITIEFGTPIPKSVSEEDVASAAARGAQMALKRLTHIEVIKITFFGAILSGELNAISCEIKVVIVNPDKFPISPIKAATVFESKAGIVEPEDISHLIMECVKSEIKRFIEYQSWAIKNLQEYTNALAS
jgi:hypothetical protein